MIVNIAERHQTILIKVSIVIVFRKVMRYLLQPHTITIFTKSIN